MTAKERPDSELSPHEKKCRDLLRHLGSQGLAVVMIIYDTKRQIQQSCQNFTGVQDALDMLESELKHIREKESH